MSGAFAALCSRLGIAPDFEDAWGRRFEVPEESRLALAAALGHPLAGGDPDRAAVAALAALDDADAARVLPPVIVLSLGEGPLTLTLQSEEAVRAGVLHWRLVLEQGGERRGRTALGRTEDGRTATVALDSSLPAGWHRLSLYLPGATPRLLVESTLALCPAACMRLPREGEGARLWGPAVQVYALRSPHSWGMGDFGDLRRLIDLAADAGAHFVGVNPLHALFPHDPERASPYSPSNREWLNVLYIDIEATRDFGECGAAQARVADPAFAARLDALRATELIDYRGVAAAKLEVLELLYTHFRREHLDRGTQRAGLFRDFQREGGRSLRLHALFDALQAHFHAVDSAVWGWTLWPEPYRDVDGEAVRAFMLENEERIEYFEYLQWQAEAQLATVARRARARGMRMGLYRDLAVGVNEGGSETWIRPHLHAAGAHAGAPPDELNPAGQDWGFPPLIPQRLQQDPSSFRAVLAANMRHAGALRIDHVMSLMRLFWLPSGGTARIGAYVGYPMDELFRLLCLESVRNECVVIGEDLGIVPPQVRAAMDRYGLLSYRPLYFESRDGVFQPARNWPADALAVVGTHDLPTLSGYWSALDLQQRDALGLYSDPALRERQAAQRESDRGALLDVLEAEGLRLPEDAASATHAADPALMLAIYRYLARTPAAMVAVQLEDVLGQAESVNLPGTSEERWPNWRRKLGCDLADIGADERWFALAAVMNAERPASALPLSGGPPDFQPREADVPRATYRLQFHGGFGFAQAEAALPYLSDLGISHIYASPYLKARPGSSHGYDIVDHGSLNPEIGDEQQFDRYCARLAEYGLGQLVDVVPNHVGVLGGSNDWWLDVLENGAASPFARHFDIDWNPPLPELQGKVLLPVLGDQYGRILEAGELQLAFDEASGAFCVRYHEHAFPVDPSDYPAILEAGVDDDGDDCGVELETLIVALAHLPVRDVESSGLRDERLRNAALFKRHLAALHARLPAVRARVESGVAAFNGTPGEPSSFDRLDALLSRQAYRLASWRVAADDINYRRFFDVNDLAALRMEESAVFDATHAQIFRWVAQGRVTGMRIDHPDGLSDPAAYFCRLQKQYAEARRRADPTVIEPTLYLVVEKILAEFEPLPADWPVHGATGYRFANLCHSLMVDAAQEARFTRVYRAFTGEANDFSGVLRDAKHLIMTHSLPGELGRLAAQLHAIAQCDRGTRDFTRSRLRSALGEIIAAFPAYRSYIGPAGHSQHDRRLVERAVAEAAALGLAGDASVLRFVRDVLLGAPTEPDPSLRALKLTFACRFQQFTAPVMAKAMEDTAFYRYNRLVSLNDVGGDPRTFGIGIDDFHGANERIACTHPFGLLASSTHDSKRSEDVRARIDVLSEMPGPWRFALRRWRGINQRRKSRLGDGLAPSADDEYLLYQTLIGVWPFDAAGDDAPPLRERVEAYMIKAAREAKRHTSWMNPDPAYEAALADFVRRLLAGDATRNAFLADFLPLQRTVALFGGYNSLSLLLLKLTAPGVPDTYQGCDTWCFTLVDPDNRRPVDFARRSRMLADLQARWPDGADAEGLRELVATMADGRIKLYLLWRALQIRRRFERTLREGRYMPLEVEGPVAHHVIAYARVLGQRVIITIASRLLFGLTGGDPQRVCERALWANTRVVLPACSPQRWREAFGGAVVCTDGRAGRIDVGPLFAALPLALLVPQGLEE